MPLQWSGVFKWMPSTGRRRLPGWVVRTQRCRLLYWTEEDGEGLSEEEFREKFERVFQRVGKRRSRMDSGAGRWIAKPRRRSNGCRGGMFSEFVVVVEFSTRVRFSLGERAVDSGSRRLDLEERTGWSVVIEEVAKHGDRVDEFWAQQMRFLEDVDGCGEGGQSPGIWRGGDCAEGSRGGGVRSRILEEGGEREQECPVTDVPEERVDAGVWKGLNEVRLLRYQLQTVVLARKIATRDRLSVECQLMWG